MTDLEQIERDLGHQLMTLAAAGTLKAGDGGRLIAEARARAETLAGTALGDHYRCLADSLHLAAGEAEHLAGLAERVTPAPVVKVPVQPFEVSDLESLRTLAAVVFADTSDGYGAGDSDAQQAHD